jgi:putative phage-type endonuclease
MVDTLAEPTTYTRAEWFARRRKGLGASDAAAVLGADQHRSPFQVWCEKTGQLSKEEAGEAAEWGLRLEPYVGQAFAERSGRSVTFWPQYTILQHQSLDWMICTPDAVQKCPERGHGLLQIKTASAFLAKEWADEPPPGYQVQLQHEMAVVGATWGTLCVLIGGQRLKWFDLEARPDFQEAMIEQEQAFWLRVLSYDPPPPDGSESCRRTLGRLYGIDPAKAISLTDAAMEATRRLEDAKARRKAAEEEIAACEAVVLSELEDAESGILPDGSGWKRQQINRKGYTVEPSSYTQLKRVK